MKKIDNKNIFSFIKPLWLNISNKRKKQVFISLLLITLNGIMDLISVTSILPLLYLLTSNPEAVMNKPFMKVFIEIFKINNSSQLLIFSTVVFALVALISGLLRLFNLYFNTRLSGAISSDLSVIAYSKVIYQPYNYHLNLNSSEVITSITNYVNALNSGLISLMQLVTGLVLSLFIIIVRIKI